MKEKILWGIAVIGLLLGVMSVVSNPKANSVFGAAGNMLAENYIPYVQYNGGYNSAKPMNLTGTFDVSGAVTLTSTFSVSGIATSSGKHIFDGGVIRSYNNSTTTTATSQTLAAADIAPSGIPYDTVFITPNTGDLTLTFPASSTLSAFIPTAGDMAEQCWYNASTTAGIDITFAAGTGVDLEVASSTSGGLQSPVLTMLADSGTCFTYVRKPATTAAFDILLLMTRFVNGD